MIISLIENIVMFDMGKVPYGSVYHELKDNMLVVWQRFVASEFELELLILGVEFEVVLGEKIVLVE